MSSTSVGDLVSKIREAHGSEAASAMEGIGAWIVKKGFRLAVDPDAPDRGPAYGPVQGGIGVAVIGIWPNQGYLTLRLQSLKGQRPFNEPARLDRLREEMTEIRGLDWTDQPGFPRAMLDSLADEGVRGRFLKILDGAYAALQRAQGHRETL